MNTKFEDNINEATLYGKILTTPEFSHNYDDEQYYVAEVEIQRFRNCNLDSAKYDTVRVFMKEELVFNEEISINNCYKLQGKLVTSKTNGVYDVAVVVNTAELLSNLDDPQMSSIVNVSGKVTHIFTNETNYKGFVNFVVAQFDETDKKVFSTRVVIWNKLSQYVMSSTSVGDIVSIKGVINNVQAKDSETGDEFWISEIIGLAFCRRQ